MKVNPNLFVSTPAAPKSDASEARRAFEAMLSASTSRLRQNASAQPALTMTQVAQPETRRQQDPKLADAPLARPGRVIDIKV